MKKSTKAQRAARRKGKSKVAALNLTSLMDIFTILVFFLLVNSSDANKPPDDPNIVLPNSMADKVPEEALKILISNYDIYVEGIKVANVPELLNAPKGPDADPMIVGLADELKYRASRSFATPNEDGIIERDVTIMADREVPYKLMKRIMMTCTSMEYSKISFAVLHSESNDPMVAATGEAG